MPSDSRQEIAPYPPASPEHIQASRAGVERLVAELLRSPRGYGFFQSVLLLTRTSPGRIEPGASIQHGKESLFLRSWPSLVRSGTDIRSLVTARDTDVGPRYEMEVSFMGLYGLSSPTPSYFWDYVQTHPESALREALDIFGGRWIGFFFQAWKRYRWPLVHRENGDDPMTRRAWCLLGLGTERAPEAADLNQDSFEDPTSQLVDHPELDPFPRRLRLLAYAGLLAPRTRSAWGAEALLSDYFEHELGDGASVRVEENVFQWAYLSPPDLNRLGEANSTIGRGGVFVAGTRVPDRMGAFRLHVGPLRFGRFAGLLPDRESFATLSSLARLAAPFGLDFDIDLQVRPEEVPDWKLGAAGESAKGRLGWSTWAQSQPRTAPGVVRLRAPRE